MSNHDPRRGRSADGRRLPTTDRQAEPSGPEAAEDDNEETDYPLIKRTQQYLELRSSQRPQVGPQDSSPPSERPKGATANGESADSPHQAITDDDDLETSWNDFHRRYDPMVRRYVGYQFRDTAEFVPAADFGDCVQESWLTIIRALGRFELVLERGQFHCWIFGIVHDKVVDYWRRRHVREAHVQGMGDNGQLEIPTPESRSASHGNRELLRELVQTALQTLRSDHSATNYSILHLRFVAGNTVSEVAQQLSLEPRQVTIRQSRALQKLRELLVAYAADE